MVRIVVEKRGFSAVVEFGARGKKLASPRFRKEVGRGVIDAGRRTKTLVSKSVSKQLGIAPGKYGSAVVAHMRQSAKPEDLSFRIFAVRGGQPIENYRGLRVLKSKASQTRQTTAGRALANIGAVGSGVWNNPRIFQRSYLSSRGVPLAMLPPGARGGAKADAPAAMWTFGLKPAQSRDELGRFKASGIVYGRSRKLFGGSLKEEIVKGETLAFFEKDAPML